MSSPRKFDHDQARARHAMGTTVRETELECNTCRKWKPDRDFYSKPSAIARRGRKHQCRVCDNAARRAYRNRNRLPCANGCGALVLAPGNGQHAGTGMCRSCALKTARLRAAE